MIPETIETIPDNNRFLKQTSEYHLSQSIRHTYFWKYDVSVVDRDRQPTIMLSK